MGLYYPIAVKQDAFTVSQCGLFFLILHTRHQAKGHASSSKFSNSTHLMAMVRQIMSCIGIQKLSGFGFQERIKAGDKHFRWDVLINDLIDPFKYLPWFHYSLSHGPQNTACGCHQKCGRYPLIGHVSYHKT